MRAQQLTKWLDSTQLPWLIKEKARIDSHGNKCEIVSKVILKKNRFALFVDGHFGPSGLHGYSTWHPNEKKLTSNGRKIVGPVRYPG